MALIFIGVIVVIIGFALDVFKGIIGWQVILFGIAGFIFLVGLFLLYTYIQER
jgi:hypothetical protein